MSEPFDKFVSIEKLNTTREIWAEQFGEWALTWAIHNRDASTKHVYLKSSWCFNMPSQQAARERISQQHARVLNWHPPDQTKK